MPSLTSICYAAFYLAHVRVPGSHVYHAHEQSSPPGRTFTRLLLFLAFDTTRHARNSVVPSPLRKVINTSIVDLALFRHHHRPRHWHRTRTQLGLWHPDHRHRLVLFWEPSSTCKRKGCNTRTGAKKKGGW
ncbi:hypothetical protein R3P38DRAFT_3203724 [Favolaschia claudopus]|uniref:Secreted protein n=1 Tax=Favolaschia claudopus TaxID=2862362 RepID=A0AAW0ASH1_9AGAR